MGRIFAYVTCTRVKWEVAATEWVETGGDPDFVEDGLVRLESPIEEHGWIDVHWHPRLLQASRNDVRPFVSEDEDDKDELQDEITAALEWLEGGFEDNGDGTFYAAEAHKPYDEPWSYSYTLHFTRKGDAGEGYIEAAWHPAKDGGFEI